MTARFARHDVTEQMPSSHDRLEAILLRLASRAGKEQVFTKLYTETARLAADTADARRKAGLSFGPLDGAIVSVKEMFDVAGDVTLAGSAARGDVPPATDDALIVKRLRRAGAVIIGRTAMTEFAFTAVGLNPHRGAPGNATDPALVPGGSSSGAGVSVTEGTSEIGIGSDTGGSVRIPAALNGVVGFKPTARRVPLDGAFPLSASLDSIGPLARTVADCAAADAVMAGDEPLPLSELTLAGLRFGSPAGRLMGDLDATVGNAFASVRAKLSRAGVTIADHDIDDLLAAMAAATKPASIAAIEAAEVHAGWLTKGAAGPVDPRVAGPLSRGLSIPAATYIGMLRRRATLVEAMNERLRSIDALILPTTPITAPEIAAVSDDPAAYNRAEGLLLRNTQVANQFDLCAISLPMPDTARPAGLMLVARHGEDRRLLAIASAVEKALAS